MPPNAQNLVPGEVLRSLAKLAGVEGSPGLQKSILALALSGDEASAAALGRVLTIKAAQQAARGVPFAPAPRELLSTSNASGRVGFGHTRFDRLPFVRPLDSLVRHVVIFGASGSGKSTLVLLILLQARERAAIWAWDRHKEEFRFLVRLFPDVTVITDKEDSLNPLEVHDGLTPDQTLAGFVAIFSKCNGLLLLSRSLLLQEAHDLYVERGIFDGSTNYPTLFDLRERIAGRRHAGRQRSMQGQDSILNRLDAMLLESPKTYACVKGFPIRELGRRSIVWELTNLGEQHAQFRAMSRVHTLNAQRVRSNERGGTLRNLVVFDEAAWIARSIGSVEDLGWSPLAEILRLGREAGIGLMFASQTTNLEDALIENAATRFVFFLGHGKDVERARHALGLTREQAEFISRLGIGECIASAPPIPKPFLLNIPQVMP